MLQMLNVVLAAAASSEMPEGSILQFDKTLIINTCIQIFNIVVLTVILVKFLYKPVKKFLATRSERIQNEIKAASEERQEALELKEQYEKMLASIEQEREEILHQAYKKAMDRSDQMLFDAQQEAKVLHSRARAEFEDERKNMMDEMKRQMIEISIMMASQFVEVNIDQADHDRYIDEALADWEER